jgi:hypothetical protein
MLSIYKRFMATKVCAADFFVAKLHNLSEGPVAAVTFALKGRCGVCRRSACLWLV